MNKKYTLLARVLLVVCVALLRVHCAAQNTPLDPPRTANELRESANQILAGASPELRARHEGMALYLLDVMAHIKVTDDKSRQAFDGRAAELKTILDAVKAGQDVLSARRGQFEWAYRSNVDDSGQPIWISLPNSYDGRTPLPLVVAMHGSGHDHHYGASTQGAPDHIQIGVDGRGDSDYEGLGEQDILDATSFMTANFNIDPTRIFLYGASMGAGGVIRMLAHYPSLYAGGVMLSGWATALHLDNLLNASLDIYHGDADWVVPVDLMRLAARDLQDNKHVRYVEYPGVGHGTTTVANKGMPLAMLNEVRMNPLPRRITFTTDQVTLGRSYWIKIERLTDPHRPASVKIGAGTAGIYGLTNNVSTLRISSLHELFPGRKQIALSLDGQSIPLLDKAGVILERKQGFWVMQDSKTLSAPAYQRRGCFNIYDGQPIRIVAPTGWQTRASDKALIEKWATASCIGTPAMPFGRIPVVDESSFDAEHYDGHMVVVGSPNDNAVLKRLLPSLPVEIQGDNMVIRGVGKYAIASTAVCMNYRNPFAPGCRIVWLLNITNDTLIPDLPLPDGDGYTPEILVYDLSGKKPLLTAAADFGNDWSAPGRNVAKETTLPVSKLAEALARTYMDDLHADYALYQENDWGRDTWFGAQVLSIRSLESLLPEGLQPLCRARMTTVQITDLKKSLEKYTQFHILGSPASGKPSDFYNLVFDESLIWKLGCTAHYNFPKGSLEHTGTDVHDYLADVQGTH